MNQENIAEKTSRVKQELDKLIEEHQELETNLPAHGLKPGHLMRIEELEDMIAEKREELEDIENI